MLNQACWAQGLSVEDRACITKVAGKLPKVVTITQSRSAVWGTKAKPPVASWLAALLSLSSAHSQGLDHCQFARVDAVKDVG